MEVVPYHQINVPDQDSYYLPHHAVFKASSTTTKMRIVFDASAKTSSGQSLNDTLMIGPVIQEDLFSILVRWRLWLIGITADIKQMYLQINVHPVHRDFLRLFWRKSNDQHMLIYRMKKVIFGSACDSFQAVRTLIKLAEDNQEKFPLASQAIKSDFYIDDVMTGANTVDSAVLLQQELLELLSSASFHLRKWSSSSTEVIASLPPELRETSCPFSIDKDETTKALGLIWNPTSDDFRFEVQEPQSTKITKRNMLSEIARIFDPLGFLSPVTIRAKMLMQTLWKEKVGWDENPSEESVKVWQSYQGDLKNINQIRIPRCICMKNYITVQLHVFSDASEKAYAAAAYLWSVSPTNLQVRLIASKTKVAPVKVISVPRLELCGAILAAELANSIKLSLQGAVTHTQAWSDSTIVLGWIKRDNLNTMRTFERNRVVEIASFIPPQHWNHVPGKVNPADLPSRGISVQELLQKSTWFNGPSFLHSTSTSVGLDLNDPKGDIFTATTEIPPKPQVINVHLTSLKNDIMELLLKRYSDWHKLKLHVAWWIRLWHFHNKAAGSIADTRVLTIKEIQKAEERVIHYVQRTVFNEEINALKSNEKMQKKSPLLALCKFLDANQLLRVGGRLKFSRLRYNEKHPLLLPRHHITILIIQALHERLHHGGNQLILASLQRQYWVSRGRSLVRSVINRCKICTIHKGETAQQLMADLPADRVTPSRAFLHSSVDYAGPIVLRDSIGRNPKTHKAYIAVFVCLSTKAVHLELVSRMSTEAFLAALRRMISRRGLPQIIRSDNGSNFVGANRELQEFIAFTSSDNTSEIVRRNLTKENIDWTYNPPGAPHMGRLWEAAVKSTKFHLCRVLGKTALTFEEYSTLLCEVEAILNSRKPCPLNSDPESYEALTPGHFIIGTQLIATPEHD